MRISTGIVVCFSILSLAGCATVGPASVKLSSETAARSAELGTLHQELVRNYFASERQRVETFLKEKWEPQYLRNLLGMSGIMSDLKKSMSFDEAKRNELKAALELYLDDDSEAPKVVNEVTAALTKTRGDEPTEVRKILNKFVPDEQLESATAHLAALLGTHEPALLIVEFARDAHEEMAKQREEMLAPIDIAEKQVLAELTASYTTLARAQGTITARLEAASRAREQQDKLLMTAGIENPSTLRERLGNVSNNIGNALKAVDGLNNPTAIINVLTAKLTNLSEKAPPQAPAPEATNP